MEGRMAGEMVLHGYWRSGTSYRTRIALNVKRLDYRQVPVDLRAGAQHSEAFRALNPQGLVPALEAGDAVLTQSSAIIEWLEEVHPEPPLLPENANERAIVRAMAMAVACDIHPLNNLRVLNRLREQFGVDSDGVKVWIAHWIREGSAAIESMIAQHGGRFAFGDSLTMADCHLVPQIYSAERFGVDISEFPLLVAAGANAAAEPPVAAAHPDRQPDAGEG
jgi:maleylpyruvate isomerase